MRCMQQTGPFRRSRGDGIAQRVFRPWWPWSLTFDLDIQTRSCQGQSTSSLWIWRKSLQPFTRYLIQKQKHKVTDSAKTETYACSPLRVIIMQRYKASETISMAWMRTSWLFFSARWISYMSLYIIEDSFGRPNGQAIMIYSCDWFIMTALCNRAGHYIFALWFISH